MIGLGVLDLLDAVGRPVYRSRRVAESLLRRDAPSTAHRVRCLGGMSRWTDPEEWGRLVSREGCPICGRDHPTSIIAELETSWVVMGEETPPLPGTCALFFRRHAIELHDLTADEAAAYMRDIQRLSRTLKAITGAVKMNYEVHGNTVPHLHMHFFPRYVGDPFVGGPINPHAAPGSTRAHDKHKEIRQRLQAALNPDSEAGVPLA